MDARVSSSQSEPKPARVLLFRYHQGRYFKHMTNVIDSAEFNGAPDLFVVLLRMELEGGECPHCGKAWHRVDVGGPCGGFHYHDPSCSCFPRCPECGSSHHRSVALHESYVPCPSCSQAYARANRRLAKKGKKIVRAGDLRYS